MRFLAVDAFCGAGGLSLGLQDAGFDVLAGFDIDGICIDTLSANREFIAHRALRADVRSMLGGQLLSLAGVSVGELDLLAGGPPCQGFSVQRTIGADHDDRNLLIHDYGQLIREVRPRFFLIENVPGIGGKRGREVLACFLAKMRAAGYAIHEKTLDAQDYGIPQRRRRYIAIGEQINCSRKPCFEWPAPHVGRPPTVRDVIAHLPSPPTDGSEHPQIPNHRADRLSPINKARITALSEGQGRTDLPEHLLAKCHRVSADIAGHRNVYGRMAWDDVSPTITARFDSFTRGKFGHPAEARTISLREGALLQTFPEAYRFVGTKVDVARQIGNAVPPRLGEVLGRAIIRALQLQDLAN